MFVLAAFLIFKLLFVDYIENFRNSVEIVARIVIDIDTSLFVGTYKAYLGTECKTHSVDELFQLDRSKRTLLFLLLVQNVGGNIIGAYLFFQFTDGILAFDSFHCKILLFLCGQGHKRSCVTGGKLTFRNQSYYLGA